MPSLTLLTADPHLTPVRARPSLVFGGRSGSTVSGMEGARRDRVRRASLSLRRRRTWASPASARRPRLGWRHAVAVALVALIGGGLGVLRVWPPFAVVMSGSMAPTINTGDMVVLQRLRAPARVGEVVEVPVPDEARSRYGYPPVVIHRVFRITGGQIRTKGDARPDADPFTVPRTAVAAKVVAHIPAGGRILAFFHSGAGLVWLLFGGVLFFGLPLLDRLRDARGREVEATTGLRDEFATVSAELVHLRAEQERSREAAAETVEHIDRLTRLIAGALGQDLTPATEGTSAATTSAVDIADHALGATADTGGAPTTEPAAAPAPAPDRHRRPDQERTCERGAALDLLNGCEPDPEPDLADGREPVVPAGPDPEPIPVVQAAAVQPTAAAETLSGRRSDDAVAAAVVSSSRLVRLSREPLIAASPVVAAGPTAPIGVVPLVAAAAVTAHRWDAPPEAISAGACGWAGPPSPVRSARFRRSGRLVAASLAQPSPAA